MKTTISVSDFRDAFYQCGRGGQFSYEALGLLFDYFEKYEDSTGVEIELDPIAVCCDFVEEMPVDIAANYDIDISAANDDDEVSEIVKDYLFDMTSLVGKTKSGTLIYQQF